MAAIVTLDQVSLHYSEKELLSQVSLVVQAEERIGLLGVNGAGKSTLLKLIAGVETPDSGSIVRQGGLTVAYLPQEPSFSGDLTLVEQVLAGVSPLARESAEYEARSILTRLGFDDLTQRTGTLSGGQKKRVALASVLVNTVDLLLLDEPTNHIDSQMVDWLEQALKRRSGALIMVTHDRYFLDRVTGRILEVSGGSVYSYQANYAGYLEAKAARAEMEASRERKLRTLYRKELSWIRQGAQARTTKAQFRVDRFEQLKQSLEPGPEAGSLQMDSVASRLGKKIVELQGISASMGGRRLLKDFSYTLLRDDRVGIIGPNGCGKTTLLRIILGELEPESGSVAIGDTVRLGYFAQQHPAMDPDQRVIDAVREVAEVVRTSDGAITASQMLERFLFPSPLQYTQVARLSGGEKRRLHLLKVLMGAPNVLLLDEPTNDLDIETLTVLEDYLDRFPGAVVTVSHDRYFLDRVVNRIFAFEDGRLTQYEGGYTDYTARRPDEPEASSAPQRQPSVAPQQPRPRKLKFSFKEQREFETIEDTIAALEQRLRGLERAIEQNASDYLELGRLMAERDQAQAQLDGAMDRWVYLTDLNERIEAEKGQ